MATTSCKVDMMEGHLSIPPHTTTPVMATTSCRGCSSSVSGPEIAPEAMAEVFAVLPLAAAVLAAVAVAFACSLSCLRQLTRRYLSWGVQRASTRSRGQISLQGGGRSRGEGGACECVCVCVWRLQFKF